MTGLSRAYQAYPGIDLTLELSIVLSGTIATAAIVSCPGGRPTGSRADWPVAL